LKSDLFYLEHMLECIDRIERYCASGEERFGSDELIQDGVLRNLQVLTESSQRISAELKSRHSEVDWRGLAGFRNVVVHDYLGINVARVWRIVNVDLPVLNTTSPQFAQNWPDKFETFGAAEAATQCALIALNDGKACRCCGIGLTRGRRARAMAEIPKPRHTATRRWQT
jgi:uncharacterized protein with HEPN domain